VLPASSVPSPDPLIPAYTPNTAIVTGVQISESTGHPLPVVSSEPHEDLIVPVDTPDVSTRVNLVQTSVHVSPGSSISVESEDGSVSVDTPSSRSSLGDSGQSSGNSMPISFQYHLR